MLLRSKAELINSNIIHLTYTLVGTVNSEHESACIPNPVAFQDLLAGVCSLWLPVCLLLCLSVCLSEFLSVSYSRLSVRLSVYLSSW